MRDVDLVREAEILSYQVLDAPELPALRQIADLAAEITGAAVAEINLVTATDIHRIATTNDNAGTIVPNEIGFCSRVIEGAGDSPHVIEDTTRDDRFRSSPFVVGSPHIRFYAGSTLTSPRGVSFGTLCVWDEKSLPFTADHVTTFEQLAALVTTILEQHRLEAELAGALNRLADSHTTLGRSHESLEAFAGQVSHDIRGPLTTIRLALELASESEDVDPEEGRFLVQRALSGVMRLNSTVQDVMDFALLGGSADPVPVDVATIVREVLDDLDGVIGDASITVEELPVVLAHEGQVRVVIQNLVSNAVKFAAPHGPPQIRIHGATHEGVARICIADNGPGVPEEQRSAIFGLMVRGDNETVEGHGIGAGHLRADHPHLRRSGRGRGSARGWRRLLVRAPRGRCRVVSRSR